jgi:PAS domain S-box-containing protein
MVTSTLLPDTLFRTIVEQAPASIRIYAPDGTCLYVNPAWERLWGTTLDEIGGYNVLQDQQLVERGVMPYLQRAFAGEHVAIPVFKYEPDHHQHVPYRWIESTAYPLLDERGQVSLVVILGIDATARMDAEAKLQEKEAQYRSIFEATTDGLFIADFDGIIIEANPAFCVMYGYNYHELIGCDAATLNHPDYLASYKAHLETVRAGGSIHARGLSRHKDGTTFHVEAHGIPFTYAGRRHLLAIDRDVTAQVRAEEQLREKEEQYRGIFEATSDGVCIGTMDGFIVEVNPAYCALYGYSRDELIGMHGSALTHPDHWHAQSEGLEAIMSGRSVQVQSVGLRKDGTPFNVEAHGSAFTYRGTMHVLGVVRDITDRARVQELLEQRVEERTRELRALLDVSHNVASTLDLHELLGVILDELKFVVEYTGAGIAMQEGDEVRIIGYRGPGPDALALGTRIPVATIGPLWPLMCQADPLIIADVREATAEAGLYRAATGDALDGDFGYVRSWMAIPMRVKERTVGSLFLEHDAPHFYTAHQADLTLAIARQAAIAIENARLYERAQEAATLEERQRLARELHDSVSQALYGIALGARTARALLDRSPDRVAEPLDYVLTLAEAGLAEMRALIFELLPQALEAEGLVAALGKQAAAVQARHGIVITTDLGTEPAAPPEVKEALYRIAQEALHNVVKHARARHVQLHLREDTRELILEVSDDGIGFASDGAFPGHLGLHTMRDRATSLAGTLEIATAPGSGTSVRVRLPVASS